VKCGDKGFVTKAGQPCGQVIASDAPGCIHHTGTPEERHALALTGGLASRMRTIPVLPAGTPHPVLENPDGVRSLIADTIQQVRVGALDHRIAAVVIAGVTAALKLAELELAAQVGALERRLLGRRA